MATGALTVRVLIPLYLQSIGTGTFTAGTTIAQAFSTNVKVGSLIVVGVRWEGATTCAVTDSLGNVYTPVLPAGTVITVHRSQLFWARSGTAGACTVTATTAVSVPSRLMAIAEYGGVGTGDVYGAAANTGVTTSPQVNVTTTTTDALIVGWCAAAGTLTGVGAGLNSRHMTGLTAICDKLPVPTPTTTTVQWTQSESTNWYVAAAVWPAYTGSKIIDLHASTASGGGSLDFYGRPTRSVSGEAARRKVIILRRLSEYRFELAKSSDLSRIGELTQARGRSLQLALNKAGAFSCTLPLDDQLTDAVAEVETCIIVTCDQEEIWSGPIWSINETVAAGTASLQIGAVGWLQTLDKRVVRPTWNNAQPITYTDQDAGVIAFDLLARTNNDATLVSAPNFLFPGRADPTQLRTRTYQPWSGILSALNELTDIESGFDMLVDPVTRELNIYAMIGTVKDIIFEFPGDVTSVNRATDSGRITNYFTAYSQAPPQSVADFESISRLGLFEEAQSLSDVFDVEILRAFAAGEILVKARPLRIVTFQPIPESVERPYAPRVFRDYTIGDTIMLTANHGRVRFARQYLRIFSFTVNFPETGGAAVGDIQTVM